MVILEAETDRARIGLQRLQRGLDPLLAWEVESAERNLAAATLRAPFRGVVLKAMAMQGQTISPGVGVILLADPAAVEVRTTVIEEDVPLVQIGQPVELFFDAQPDAAMQGRVARIVPQRIQDEDRPLYYVYVALDAVPRGVVAGMTADASIAIAQRSDVLRLPRALVRARSDSTAQVKVWANSQEENRSVKAGLRGDVYVEVLEGLSEGERVVGE
jgi:multidrug efflux pump subunit AcrA (membrane-fusion protein)